MRRLPHKDVAAQALRHIAYSFDQGVVAAPRVVKCEENGGTAQARVALCRYALHRTRLAFRLRGRVGAAGSGDQDERLYTIWSPSGHRSSNTAAHRKADQHEAFRRRRQHAFPHLVDGVVFGEIAVEDLVALTQPTRHVAPKLGVQHETGKQHNVQSGVPPAPMAWRAAVA